jgi:hypothetical protein
MDVETEKEQAIATIREGIDAIEKSRYPWAAGEDESRRCFVLEQLAGVGDNGPPVSYLSDVESWLKTGAAPAGSKPTHIRPVK